MKSSLQSKKAPNESINHINDEALMWVDEENRQPLLLQCFETRSCAAMVASNNGVGVTRPLPYPVLRLPCPRLKVFSAVGIRFEFFHFLNDGHVFSSWLRYRSSNDEAFLDIIQRSVG